MSSHDPRILNPNRESVGMHLTERTRRLFKVLREVVVFAGASLLGGRFHNYTGWCVHIGPSSFTLRPLGTTMRWNDTPVILRDLTTLTKSLHLFAGLAIWEFLTNVLFDWRILIGKRKRRWTFWVYLLCRTSSVISACLVLRAIDATSNVGCEAILVPGLLFAVAAFLSSSFLVLMRLIAIWDRNRWILMVGSVIWLVNFPVVVYDYTVVRGSFDPLIRGCVVTHSAGTLTAYVTFFVTEISLLSLMFAGLLRPSMPRSSSIWQTLYVQGWAWLLLALVAEVPTLVLLCLNLNDAMNLVLQTPAMLTMSIGASRMYRSLSRSAREVYDTAKKEGTELEQGVYSNKATFSRSRSTGFGRSSTRTLEVMVHTSTATDRCLDQAEAIELDGRQRSR